MTKSITFRPTPDALLALADLEKVHGNRSKAINAALVIACHPPLTVDPENVRRDLQGIIDGGSKGVLTAKQIAENEEQLAKLEAKSKFRRTKTNATIAPRPLPPEPEIRANTLRRTIPSPKDRGLV